MNIPLLIANAPIFLVLPIHIFLGDKDMKAIEPTNKDHGYLEKWVMARGAFHVVSVDMLMTTVGLLLINFTALLDSSKTLLLKIMSIYFLLYAIAFFLCIVISRSFPKNYLKLIQWAFFILVSGLIY